MLSRCDQNRVRNELYAERLLRKITPIDRRDQWLSIGAIPIKKRLGIQPFADPVLVTTWQHNATPTT